MPDDALAIPPKTFFSKSRDFLWPLGAALLGLLVMPLAIDQYPEFFHANAWILPVSTATVIALFVAPLLFHHRVPRLVSWILQKQSKLGWRVTKAISALVILGFIVCGFAMGSRRLVRYHTWHIAKLLASKGNDYKQSQAATVSNASTQQASVNASQSVQPAPANHPALLSKPKVKPPVAFNLNGSSDAEINGSYILGSVTAKNSAGFKSKNNYVAPTTDDPIEQARKAQQLPTTINQGPGSAISFGQQGGITAGTVIEGDPPPQFDLTRLSENVLTSQGLYETKFRLQVTTKRTMVLQLRATGSSLAACLSVMPEAGGGVVENNAQCGPSFSKTSVQNVESGTYLITVLSTQPDQVHLEYGP